MRSQLGIAAIAYFAANEQVYGATVQNKMAEQL